MIELIFVIVVIGILTAIALPRFSDSADSAYISKAQSQLAAVRSAIATERQKRILKGSFSNIGDLGDSTYAFSYFDNNSSRPVLDYPVENCVSGQTGCWKRGATGNTKTFSYVFPEDSSKKAIYELKNNRLVCKRGNSNRTNCKQLLR